MFNEPLFWIWFTGFALLSIPVFIVWMLNSALLGDSCDKWYRRRMFVWFTFLGFAFTWLWPVALVGAGIYSAYKWDKKRRWDKVWKQKKATVPNYWKNYHLIIDGNVTDIQVRVLDWDFHNGKARLAMWRGEQRFWAEGKEIIVYWPNKDLAPIPEKLEKV